MFEWDEQKRAVNLAKHGVDFERAKLIFESPTLEGTDERRGYGEERIGAYGAVDDEIFFVVYTWRGNSRRIISARKVGTHERKMYAAQIARKSEGGE